MQIVQLAVGGLMASKGGIKFLEQLWSSLVVKITISCFLGMNQLAGLNELHFEVTSRARIFGCGHGGARIGCQY